MAFRTLLVIGILFLIHSCAQVSSLTGGDKDIIAPKPNHNKMTPKNGAINFIGSEIKIPFDEFVKLENPNETIIMVPPHAKPTARIVKKTVYINWTDSLQMNTTYSLYLNGTVKDITEGNDSLMQLVFSTGNYIDSLGYQVKVIDAFSNEPIKNCLVGLYEGKTDSIRPTYFVKTSEQGIAKFNYLKKGDYTILAFDDKNKDMLLESDEKMAFSSKKVSLSADRMDSNYVLIDSIPLRLFSQKLKPRIRSLVYKAPGMYCVGATAPIKNAKFSVNNLPLLPKDYKFITEDSLVFFYSIGDSSSLNFISSSGSFIDTASIRLTKREKEGKLSFSNNLNDNFLYPTDTLSFIFTDKITEVTPLGFQLINKDDSSNVIIKKIDFDKNKLTILFDKKKMKSAELVIQPSAIKSVNSNLKDSLQLKFQLKEDKDFGSIKLDASEYTEPIVVEILSAGKVIRTIPMNEKKQILLEYLLPYDYTFRVILDANKNGKWDTGEFENGIFPEINHTFSEITKVRANWEIDLKLTKKD
jgi:uncharacterized protein (DUF2141 family)